MPGRSVRVVASDVGGGFGGKGSLYQEEIVVALLAHDLGRAVRWTGDRLEDLTSTSQGFDEIVDAELALDNDSHILALKAEIIGDVGAYSVYPWTAALEPVQVASFMPGPYRVPIYRGRVRAVATCKAPTGPYRGVGRPISTFVMERLIDMAARRLNVDPGELRRRNLIAGEEFPLRALGHEPRIVPAIYVKPFLKGQKNDYNDAEAIAEAATAEPAVRPGEEPGSAGPAGLPPGAVTIGVPSNRDDQPDRRLSDRARHCCQGRPAGPPQVALRDTR